MSTFKNFLEMKLFITLVFLALAIAVAESVIIRQCNRFCQRPVRDNFRGVEQCCRTTRGPLGRLHSRGRCDPLGNALCEVPILNRGSRQTRVKAKVGGGGGKGKGSVAKVKATVGSKGGLANANVGVGNILNTRVRLRRQLVNAKVKLGGGRQIAVANANIGSGSAANVGAKAGNLVKAKVTAG